jgi:hypothetical protein
MGTHVSQAPDRRVGIVVETMSCWSEAKTWRRWGRVGCTGITMWKTHFGNRQSACYQSSVTNEPRKVTGRCPLLITHIRSGHKTTTVTTTNHRSHEMVVSLDPQRTLVTGTKTKPVRGTEYQRRVLWNYISDISIKWDASISRASQHN